MSMIDKAVFLDMNGASAAMKEIQVIANNLANVNTPAFRADSLVVKQTPIADQGLQSRVYSSFDHTFTDFTQGPTFSTGRDLDIAIAGDGFIAVQNKKGEEAYTRSGSLQLTKDGVLTTANGELILGNGGAIRLPPAEKVHIGSSGAISVKLIGKNEMVPVDKIKLTNPDTKQLQKGEDGLFYTTTHTAVPVDDKIHIVTNALEGSNVNPVETLTKLIDVSRHYEIHTNLIKTLADNATKANQLLESV